MNVTWTARDEPLAVEAAFAKGEAARALAKRVLAMADIALFRAVASDELLVLLGDHLPWVDGIVYLGREHEAPRMYLPTTLAPSVAPAMLARSVERQKPIADGPFALVPPLIVPLIIPLAAAMPLDRSRLEAWLARA